MDNYYEDEILDYVDAYTEESGDDNLDYFNISGTKI